MRAVLQRTSQASVTVDGEIESEEEVTDPWLDTLKDQQAELSKQSPPEEAKAEP